MKRSVLIILSLLLTLSLFGCANDSADEQAGNATDPSSESSVPADYKFPENIRAAGVDVGGLSVSQAYDRIAKKLENYILTVDINGNITYYTGSELELSCDKQALSDFAAAVSAGKSTEAMRLLRYNEDFLSGHLFNSVNTPAQNAQIVFNTETGLFELTAGSMGYLADMDTVTQAVDAGIQRLKQTVSMEAPMESYSPAIDENSSLAKVALDRANEYVTTEITYDFIEDDDISSVTITPQQVAAMVGFDYDLTPYIKTDALKEYVRDLSTKYGLTGIDSSFKTTAGTMTDLTVTYYYSYLDTEALYDQILSYLENGISGTRIPPRLDTLIPQEIPYKGNCIEVDLTGQVLYLYKDMECILETPIVTGCVSRYMNTPTGVYSVRSKAMHVILKGDDYETYVKYWMQFWGGYGLHDAYWRYRFGGNEYLYNGSHGCVNIPPDNAGFVYENVYLGYPVILYGGANNKEPLQQSILGQEAYAATIYTKPFQLDAKTAIGNCELTYTSSDPSVASVAEDGTVTVHKTGNAVIRVEYEESRYYTGASFQVEINVSDPCSGKHKFGSWEVAAEPSCADGEQIRTCTVCAKEESKTIAATSAHTYGDWEVTVEPDCMDGEESQTCSVCGDIAYRAVPAEHRLRDWSTREKATCEEAGERYRTCRWCDYEETEVLPALGHSFSPEEEFCENCDASNPDWVPPTEEDENT